MVQLVQRGRRDESGAILVIVALALVVLVGISALVLDLGLAHIEQRKLQNSADAAALGAAQDLTRLAGTTAPAVTDAQNLAGQNLPNHTLNWSSLPACTGTSLPIRLVTTSPAAQTISTHSRPRKASATFPTTAPSRDPTPSGPRRETSSGKKRPP